MQVSAASQMQVKNRKINIQKSKSSIRSSRLLSLLLASGLNHREVPLIPFTCLLFYPHLPTSTHCWDKPIHAWPVLSLSSSMLNKTCAPHAAALCFLQITATLPLSRLSHPSMVSVSSLLPFISADAFQTISFLCVLLLLHLLFSFPSPIFLSLPLPFLPPSLLHLIALILPGDRLWTELPPLVREPWVVDCTERTPKALQATSPLPPVCTVEAEDEVCKTTLLSLLLPATQAHRHREDGLPWRQKARREERLYNSGRVERGKDR